jgi:hypothetical protein
MNFNNRLLIGLLFVVGFMGTVSCAEEDNDDQDNIEVIDINEGDIQRVFAVPLDDKTKDYYQQLESDFFEEKLKGYKYSLEQCESYRDSFMGLCLEHKNNEKNISEDDISSCVYVTKVDDMINELSNEIKELQAGSFSAGFIVVDGDYDSVEYKIVDSNTKYWYRKLVSIVMGAQYYLCKKYFEKFRTYKNKFAMLCRKLKAQGIKKNIFEDDMEVCGYHKKATKMVEVIGDEIERIKSTEDYQYWQGGLLSPYYTADRLF